MAYNSGLNYCREFAVASTGGPAYMGKSARIHDKLRNGKGFPYGHPDNFRYY
jgi:hypothetical protein